MSVGERDTNREIERTALAVCILISAHISSDVVVIYCKISVTRDNCDL